MHANKTIIVVNQFYENTGDFHNIDKPMKEKDLEEAHVSLIDTSPPLKFNSSANKNQSGNTLADGQIIGMGFWRVLLSRQRSAGARGKIVFKDGSEGRQCPRPASGQPSPKQSKAGNWSRHYVLCFSTLV